MPSRFSSGSTTYEILSENLENKKPPTVMFVGGCCIDVSLETIFCGGLGIGIPGQNCVPIWRWILWAKMTCSRCPKAVSFLGADLPSLLCNLFLFYCYFFLSYPKLFFYTNVRGSNMVSHTLAYIIIIRIIIENVTGKT